ncbi:hypothetical protein ACET3Z_005043 [Daucus carota]
MWREEPKTRTATAHPTAASDGERDPAEDNGDGAGAGDSSATVDPIREKMTTIAR